ncbi:MAG TPA: DUF3857 domain-containing protein [Pyrinomonadaceae bacterium]|nr:DUF3857 domain-containing protein [Pyrinomonadaceae bacterium]
MKPRILLFILPFLFVCLFPGALRSVRGEDWRPVDPASLALKAAIVEKDADAEAIFWEVKVDDNPDGDLILTHYIRIKVFTERGRELQSKIDIAYGKIFGREIQIRDIAARTIKPDGSITELKKQDVLDRTIIKTSGARVKAKSFAIPGIEPGCVIEYRWREVRVNTSANYVRLEMQRDIPVQRVRYLIKPFPFQDYSMSSITMHGSPTKFKREKDGFYSTSMENVPALHSESRMPPEDELRTWMLIYYTKEDKIDPEKYWYNYGRRVYDSTKSLIKVNNEIKLAAATAVAGATTDDEKILNIFNFCRAKIRNISDDASGLTADERKKLKENKSPADTLKRGVGSAADIDLLFAALATAAGFDARIVLAPDRGDLFFDKALANAYFLNPSNIAVRVGDGWKFYNPGMNYVPAGMLRWQEEGQESLITDPKQPVWVRTPMSGPDKSHIKRVGTFSLSEDGTLEGDLQAEFTGHFAIERKEENDDDSVSQREENLRDEWKSRMSTAELSNIRVENVNDPIQPFIYKLQIRVPGYAQRTGRRLFLQPAVFQKGISPLFATADRKHPVYFHFPWSEYDELSINLPEGYVLDSPDAPTPFSGGAISAYTPSLSVSQDGRMLMFKRKFFFGGDNNILFPVSSYTQVKNLFDVLHKQDAHTVSLKAK